MKTDRWLLVCHPWFGLNDATRAEAARLATELGGTNVLCPDMFHGKTSTDRNSAAALMGSLSVKYARTVIAAARQYVGPAAEVATIGWGMGATLSLQAAIAMGHQGAGCVFFYGVPEEDPLLLAGLHGPVLGIFAEEDAMINTDVVSRFARNMAKAGKQLQMETYKADNGFADPSDLHPGTKAARSANARAIAFLANVLHLANIATKP
ncbi:MAG: dienelactone hydrolase family protein [Flavobacteriales bacterium]